MTNLGLQSLVVADAGLIMFLAAFWLSRRQRLSLRYGLGWMVVALLLVVTAFALLVIGGIPSSLPISATGLIAGAGLAFVLAITLQLSVSLSGHQEAIRQLSEANALLEQRLATLETLDDPHLGAQPMTGSLS